MNINEMFLALFVVIGNLCFIGFIGLCALSKIKVKL